jgi:hypothetical protein
MLLANNRLKLQPHYTVILSYICKHPYGTAPIWAGNTGALTGDRQLQNAVMPLQQSLSTLALGR